MHRNHNEYQSPRVQNQVAQLRKLDTAIFTGGASVYIRAIMVNNKDVGVYGYNRRSSHFGRVHFFLYRNDSVIPVSRSNEDSLKNTVTKFLREQNFSEHQVGKAMRHLSTVFDIN